MKRANRHFRATWWFNAVFFRSLAMIVNNIWAVRKWLGAKERCEDVRLLLAHELRAELKKTFEKNHQNLDVFGLNYVPLTVRSKADLDKVRLDFAPDHYPAKLKKVYRQCVVEKNGCKTNNYCTKCKVHVHAGNCYIKWHNDNGLV